MNEKYFQDLVIEFPILEQVINDEDPGMDHIRMERFADYTIAQIKNDNKTELKRCFNFQESKLELISSDLLNAVYVSYCEALLLGDCANKMKKIVHLMPPRLKAIYIDYEKFYDGLTKKSK